MANEISLKNSQQSIEHFRRNPKKRSTEERAKLNKKNIQEFKEFFKF